jgi:diacylglycerol O-acyltransferase / wax synthase
MGHYERLSAQDSSFVLWERRETPMHVGAVAILDAAPLATADGGIDTERILKHVESRLHRLPRYRKRLAFTPIEGHPVWIDDVHFDLGYHVRRTALPRPGTEAELKSLVARILSQRLDRDRPLWEMWIVEGLDGGRFALVTKVHHCMVDGASGMNLLTLLMSPSADEPAVAAPAWSPELEPTALELLAAESARRTRLGGELAAAALRAAADPAAAWARISEAGHAIAEAIDAGLRHPGATHLNRPIGPHRRVDWLGLDLSAAKQVKERLGGTLNDVVLATVCGALHHFLGGRREWNTRLDYRIVMPVNMRPAGDERAGGNCVSAYFLSLPIAEADPRLRYEAIHAATAALKGSHAAEGIDLLTQLADRVGGTLMTRLGGLFIDRLRPYNLIVTNVPGPQFPLYVLGARLLELIPQLPLFEQQGLGVAALSYCGKLQVGLIGDRELASDLGSLREAMLASFAELEDAARRSAERRAPRRKRGVRPLREPALREQR